MFDIIGAMCVLILLSMCGMKLGARWGRTRNSANATALIIVAWTIVFVEWIHGQLFLAKLIPFSNVIILGNLLPVFASVLAGVVLVRMEIPAARRILLTMSLLVAGWVTVVWNVYPQQFRSYNSYKTGICLQSTPATCGACSAVTLLNYAGIEANEKEMSDLCLTSGRGTNLLGIYRGLKKKTNGTPYRVEVVDCEFDRLQEHAQFPILVALQQKSTGGITSFPIGNEITVFLTQLLGPADHCVVLLGMTNQGKVIVGDPSQVISNPREVPAHLIRQDWLAQGFRLVKRGE